MKKFYTLVVSLAVVFNTIESSGFQKKLKTKASSSEEGDESNDELTTPSLPKRKKFLILSQPAELQNGSHLSEKQHLKRFKKFANIERGENSTEFSSQSSATPLQRPSLPPHRLPSPRESLLTATDLQDIRLMPKKNPNRVFEIKEHIFPPGVELELKEGCARSVPMPTVVQRVLITSDGVIFAIFCRNNILRGMYKPKALCGERAKMNILTRYIEKMNSTEDEEVPVGKKNLITDNYIIERLPPCN